MAGDPGSVTQLQCASVSLPIDIRGVGVGAMDTADKLCRYLKHSLLVGGEEETQESHETQRPCQGMRNQRKAAEEERRFRGDDCEVCGDSRERCEPPRTPEWPFSDAARRITHAPTLPSAPAQPIPTLYESQFPHL